MKKLNLNLDLDIEKLTILVLILFIVILPKINKFKISMIISNKFLNSIAIIIIILSILKNNIIGILLMIIYFYIKTISTNEINEGFFNYYQNKN